MSTEHESLPDDHGAEGRAQREAAHLDHEDADRLAIEHGETDFAGFTDPDAGAGEDQGDDRARPHPA